MTLRARFWAVFGAEWDFLFQVMNIEDEDKVDFDPLDCTKVNAFPKRDGSLVPFVCVLSLTGY